MSGIHKAVLPQQHMDFWLGCAAAHDLAHDFCVQRMGSHFSKLRHGLQTMSLPTPGQGGGGTQRGAMDEPYKPAGGGGGDAAGATLIPGSQSAMTLEKNDVAWQGGSTMIDAVHDRCKEFVAEYLFDILLIDHDSASKTITHGEYLDDVLECLSAIMVKEMVADPEEAAAEGGGGVKSTAHD